MPDAVRVSLVPDTVQALPSGIPITVTATVQNVGSAVDQFTLQLDGLPRAWYRLPSSSKALFPQEADEVPLAIQLPRGDVVKAGTYPFTVTAVSRADPSQSGRIVGALRVETDVAFDVDISPRRTRGRKGRYTLTLRNNGNTDLDVDLDAVDAENGCRFAVDPASCHVEAGQEAMVRLVARPDRSGLVGPDKPYDFQVTAQPSAGEPKTIGGQFVHTPRLRSWKPIRRLLALAVAAAAVGVPYNRNPLKQFVCTNTAVCTWLSDVTRTVGASGAPSPAPVAVSIAAHVPAAGAGTVPIPSGRYGVTLSSAQIAAACIVGVQSLGVASPTAPWLDEEYQRCLMLFAPS